MPLFVRCCLFALLGVVCFVGYLVLFAVVYFVCCCVCYCLLLFALFAVVFAVVCLLLFAFGWPSLLLLLLWCCLVSLGVAWCRFVACCLTLFGRLRCKLVLSFVWTVCFIVCLFGLFVWLVSLVCFFGVVVW